MHNSLEKASLIEACTLFQRRHFHWSVCTGNSRGGGHPPLFYNWLFSQSSFIVGFQQESHFYDWFPARVSLVYAVSNQYVGFIIGVQQGSHFIYSWFPAGISLFLLGLEPVSESAVSIQCRNFIVGFLARVSFRISFQPVLEFCNCFPARVPSNWFPTGVSFIAGFESRILICD